MPEKEIKDASSFEELCSILDAKGEVIGSDGKKYSASVLKGKIAILQASIKYGRVGEIFFKAITRTDGLRDKCVELYNKEMADRIIKSEK